MQWQCQPVGNTRPERANNIGPETVVFGRTRMNVGAHNPAQVEWLDLRRLQEYAPVSERTLRAWIHSPVDPLPASCVGRKILVRRSDFDAYLERHRVKQVDVNAIVKELVEGVHGR